jgi:hypothetical protein
VISWWQPPVTTVAAERALVDSSRSAHPATFDTQLRALLLGWVVPEVNVEPPPINTQNRACLSISSFLDHMHNTSDRYGVPTTD